VSFVFLFLGGTGGGFGGGGANLVGVNRAPVAGVGESRSGDEGGRGRGEGGRGEGVEGAKETEREEGEGRRVDSMASWFVSPLRWRAIELVEVGLVIAVSEGLLKGNGESI
jgi:hypothetical protein